MKQIKQLKFSEEHLTHHLFHGNSLEILPQLSKESIDLLLCDPPFNISQNIVIKRDQCVDYNLNFGCLESKTIIPTSNGMKFIKNVTLQDKIINSNGNWIDVKQIFKYKINSNLIEIKAGYSELLRLTPNHRIPILKREDIRALIWNPILKQANEISEGDYLTLPRLNSTQDINYLYPNKEGRKHQLKKVFDQSISLPNKIPVNNSLMRMFGLFIAEGSFSPHEYFIKFTLNKNETEYIQFILKTFEELFNVIGHTYLKGENGIDVRFDSKELYWMFYRIFTLNKIIPPWFIELPIKKQIAFITGWWQGDGCDCYYSSEIATEHQKNAYMAKFIMMRFGLFPTISRREYKNSNHKDSFRIIISGKQREIGFKNKNKQSKISLNRWYFFNNNFCFPVKSVKETNFTGTVYDLKTDDYYSTKSFLVHNSWDQEKIFPEDWIPLVVPLMKKTGVLITFTGKRLAERTMETLEREGCFIRILGPWITPEYCPVFRAKTWASATNMFVIATMTKKNIHHFASNLKQHPDYILVPHQGVLQYHREREKWGHPTQKPRRVIEELMKYWSFERDVILDCFSGVNTTGFIAERLGRNSIAIERDQIYYGQGKIRLENAIANTKLFNQKSKIVEH